MGRTTDDCGIAATATAKAATETAKRILRIGGLTENAESERVKLNVKIEVDDERELL